MSLAGRERERLARSSRKQASLRDRCKKCIEGVAGTGHQRCRKLGERSSNEIATRAAMQKTPESSGDDQRHIAAAGKDQVLVVLACCDFRGQTSKGEASLPSAAIFSNLSRGFCSRIQRN